MLPWGIICTCRFPGGNQGNRARTVEHFSSHLPGECKEKRIEESYHPVTPRPLVQPGRTISQQARYPASSSLNPSHARARDFYYEWPESVKTLTIPSTLSKFEFGSIDYPKMNCGGCEYEVIPNLEPKDFRTISQIELERHDGPKPFPRTWKNVALP